MQLTRRGRLQDGEAGEEKTCQNIDDEGTKKEEVKTVKQPSVKPASVSPAGGVSAAPGGVSGAPGAPGAATEATQDKTAMKTTVQGDSKAAPQPSTKFMI